MSTKTRTVKGETATVIVTRVCNEMGISLEHLVTKDRPMWKVVAIEAGKINKAMAKDKRVTFASLSRAIDWAKAHNVRLRTPYAIVYQVEKMLEDEAAQRAPRPGTDAVLEEAIASALDREAGRVGDPTAIEWISRFRRAVGPGRQQCYMEWLEAGR